MSDHKLGHPTELDDDKGRADRREALAHLDRFLVRYYGERCSDVQPGCSCCVVWAARDMLHAATFE